MHRRRAKILTFTATPLPGWYSVMAFVCIDLTIHRFFYTTFWYLPKRNAARFVIRGFHIYYRVPSTFLALGAISHLQFFKLKNRNPSCVWSQPLLAGPKGWLRTPNHMPWTQPIFALFDQNALDNKDKPLQNLNSKVFIVENWNLFGSADEKILGSNCSLTFILIKNWETVPLVIVTKIRSWVSPDIRASNHRVCTVIRGALLHFAFSFDSTRTQWHYVGPEI